MAPLGTFKIQGNKYELLQKCYKNYNRAQFSLCREKREEKKPEPEETN